MSGRLPLHLVAAIADNGVIGDDNRLIWRLKSDLKRFRTITWGKPLIMGRKTFASIGKPLPGRETIVLTRDPGFVVEGATVARDLSEALARGQEIGARMGAEAIVVAGGAEVYAQALPLCDALRLTLVHANPPGDARFPDFERAAFLEMAREAHPAGPDDEHPFTFLDLKRR